MGIGLLLLLSVFSICFILFQKPVEKTGRKNFRDVTTKYTFQKTKVNIYYKGGECLIAYKFIIARITISFTQNCSNSKTKFLLDSRN